MIIQLRETAHGICVSEFPFEHVRVALPRAKAYERADVAKNGIADFRLQLLDVLVREGEAQPILPGFRQNRNEGICSEGLEFVNMQEKVLSIVLRHVRARHGRKLKLRDKKRAN